MGTPPCFTGMFLKKGNFRDFLFANLEDEVFLKGVKSLRKEFAPLGANSKLMIWEVNLSSKFQSKLMRWEVRLKHWRKHFRMNLKAGCMQ